MEHEKDLLRDWFIADKLFRLIEFTLIFSTVYYFKQKIDSGYIDFLFYVCTFSLLGIIISLTEVTTKMFFPKPKTMTAKYLSWFTMLVIIDLFALVIFKAIMQITEHSF